MSTSHPAATEQPATSPIKLLWVNPVNTTDYDQPIADLIKAVKLPNAEVEVVSLRLPSTVKLTNLEWRAYEAMIWSSVTALAYHAGNQGFDGYAIGCFYDTALDEAREVSGNAVVCGPCEAALRTISPLCNRFSVVIGVEKWRVQMEERIRHYGFHNRLASFRTIGLHVDEFQKDRERTEEAICKAVKEAIEIDKAEAIILGCTIEFGFYAELQKRFNVPVIDVVYACYKATEHAALNKVQFGWKPSRKYSMEPPDAKQLADSGIFGGAPPIGNRITVPRG